VARGTYELEEALAQPKGELVEPEHAVVWQAEKLAEPEATAF
jgi:hypothetical protein